MATELEISTSVNSVGQPSLLNYAVFNERRSIKVETILLLIWAQDGLGVTPISMTACKELGLMGDSFSLGESPNKTSFAANNELGMDVDFWRGELAHSPLLNDSLLLNLLSEYSS